MGITCLNPGKFLATFNLEQIIPLIELYLKKISMRNLSDLRIQLQSYIHHVGSEPAFISLPDIGSLA